MSNKTDSKKNNLSKQTSHNYNGGKHRSAWWPSFCAGILTFPFFSCASIQRQISAML